MKIYFVPKLLFIFLFFFFSTIYSFSQLNEWTWLKGANTTNSSGNAGIPNIPSVNNDPSSRKEYAYWKDNSGNFWVFGGYSGHTLIASYFDDLWKYNPSTNEWTQIHPEGASNPSARCQTAFWADHSGNLWLFGGLGFSAMGLNQLGDLWRYNVNSNTWSFVSGSLIAPEHSVYGSLGVSSADTRPGARNVSSHWVDANGDFWLFGGVGYAASNTIQSQLNDFWKYNISSNRWTWMHGDSIVNAPNVYGSINIPSPLNKPAGRTFSITWTDNDNNLWLYGGSTKSDLWKYNIVTNEWMWVNGSTLSVQPPLYGTTGIPDIANHPGSMNNGLGWTGSNGDLWLFGGRAIYSGIGTGTMGGFWRYNITGNIWTFIGGGYGFYGAGVYGTMGVPDPDNIPGAREGSGGWVDNSGNLWLFAGGGFAPSGTGAPFFEYNDVWKFTLNMVVPVKLISFTGKLKDGNTFLNWLVENEINLDHYEIERSINGIDFEKRSTVKATNIKEYNTTDNVWELEEDIIYYRLKMVDIDKKFSYSNIIKFHVPLNVRFSIYPNPANTYTTLKFNKNLAGKVNVQVTDAIGKIILKNNYDLENGEVFISTSKFAEGTYPVTVVYKGERFIQNLVIIR